MSIGSSVSSMVWTTGMPDCSSRRRGAVGLVDAGDDHRLGMLAEQRGDGLLFLGRRGSAS